MDLVACVHSCDLRIGVENTHSQVAKADVRRHLVANVGNAIWSGRMLLIGQRRLWPNSGLPMRFDEWLLRPESRPGRRAASTIRKGSFSVIYSVRSAIVIRADVGQLDDIGVGQEGEATEIRVRILPEFGFLIMQFHPMDSAA